MIEKTFETPGELALALTIPAGSIEVETVDGAEMQVTLDCDDADALDDARVELRERGGGHELLVEVERRRGILGGINIQLGGLSLGRHYRLRVRCPHGAALAAKTASADVTATGRYASADVGTASGRLRLGEIERDATVKTVSADAEIARVGGDLRLNSVSGDARVGEVGGSLIAQTVSGDVSARDVGADVTLKSVSGDFETTVSQGTVQLTSVSGDLHVGVRRGSRVHVDANSVSGALDSELELADGPDGGEGPLVELRAKSVSGDFRVVRAPARETTRA